MAPLRRSSLPGLCLTLLMGLALAWPGLAHRPLHALAEHGHEHHEMGVTLIPGQLSIGSAEQVVAHPHLELTAATPTKSGLLLFFVLSTPGDLDDPVTRPHVTVGLRPASGTPRSPPVTPPPPIRAPPTA